MQICESCETCGLPFEYVKDSAKPPRRFCGFLCRNRYKLGLGTSDEAKIRNLRNEIAWHMESYEYAGNPQYLVLADRCCKPLQKLTGWHDVTV